jgi:hypothetical protein
MAHHQEPAGHQQLGQPREQLLLEFPVEVDHHVAAEDHVVGLLRRPHGRLQVQLAEARHGAQLGTHAHQPVVAAGAAQEMAAQALGRQRRDALHAVDAGARRVQHVGVDVGAQHLPGTLGLAQHHRDRPGLLAGGTRARPAAQRRPALARVLLRPRQQQLEVVRLAEESRQVGGERVDEGLALVGVRALYQLQVVAEARDAARAQPAQQPVVDHVALLQAELDARVVGDQLPHGREVAVVQQRGRVAAQQRVSHWGEGPGNSHRPQNSFHSPPGAAAGRAGAPSTPVKLGGSLAGAGFTWMGGGCTAAGVGLAVTGCSGVIACT